MRYVGNFKAITTPLEERDTQVATPSKATVISILILQEAEAMINKVTGQERKKLARAKELLRKDTQKYWNERRNKDRSYMPINNKGSQINKVEETGSASKEEFSQEEELIDHEEIEEVNFPYS